MEHEEPDLVALQNIFVYTLGSKINVRVSDFYATQRIVLVIFRRFVLLFNVVYLLYVVVFVYSMSSLSLISVCLLLIFILTFHCRFGCVLCREAAVEISKLKHVLDSMNVRLIGVGFETDEKHVYDFLMYP